jgi:HK97 family phage major capsid protein
VSNSRMAGVEADLDHEVKAALAIVAKKDKATAEEVEQGYVHLDRIRELKAEKQKLERREFAQAWVEDFPVRLGDGFDQKGRAAVGQRDDESPFVIKAMEYFAQQKTLTTSGTIAVPAPTLDTVRDPERPRFVSDLIPAMPTTGSVEPYYRQTTRTFRAAPVDTATGTKPESDLAVSRIEAAIITVAHLVDGVKKSDLADARWLQDFIGSEMLYGLRLAVDDQIIFGDGAYPEVQGILTAPSVQTQTFATDALTSIRKGLTKLQLESFEPTAMVMHPNDGESLDLTQDGNQRYYFAGPAASGASPVWSVPVVLTPAMTPGTAIMGDFAGGSRIFSRQEATIDFTEALLFKQNKVTFRAELRMGFGVLRPKAFVLIDLAA